MAGWDFFSTKRSTYFFSALLGVVLWPDLLSASPPELRVGVPSSGLITAEKIALPVRIFAWETEKTPYRLRGTMAGWDGQETVLPERTLEAEGEWKGEVEIPLPRYGPYSCRFELLSQSGEVLAESECSLVRPVPQPELAREERLRSPIGLNVHSSADWENLAKLGVHWARDYSWSWLKGWLRGSEAAPVINGTDFLEEVKSAEDAGIIVLPVLSTVFRNEDNSAFLKDRNYISGSFERLTGLFPDLPYWHLENEMEYNLKDRFSLEDYQVYISAAAEGLRRTGLPARVGLGGTAGLLFDQTEKLLGSGVAGDFEVVSYHHYTGRTPPETAYLDINVGGDERPADLLVIDQFRRMNMMAHRAGKQVWLTETGWDATKGPFVGERMQALYLARIYLLARWLGTDKTFWFFDRDCPDLPDKFATCGLRNAAGFYRPCAAALAMVSSVLGRAEPGGSLDLGLGPDVWALLFRQSGGEWVLAAWSVKENHELPERLKEVPARDVFGNAITPRELSPEVTYFSWKSLPPDWEEERQVELLSPRDVYAARGDAPAVQLACGGGAFSLKWKNLPPDVSEGEIVRKANGAEQPLILGKAAPLGRHVLDLRAEGKGWHKDWQIALEIRPPLTVSAKPWQADRDNPIMIRSEARTSRTVRLSVPKTSGRLSVENVTLPAHGRMPVSFRPDKSAQDPVPLSLEYEDGEHQTFLLRPSAFAAPQSDAIRVDGKNDDWPVVGRMGPGYFSGNLETASAALAWSREGVFLMARLPIRDLSSADARKFWDGPHWEFFADVDSSGSASAGSTTSHQFFFVPVRDGQGWKLEAGEWKRSAAIPETIYNDARIKTAMSYEQGIVTMEAFLPRAVFGMAELAPGNSWRALITLRGGSARSSSAWPESKSAAVLADSRRWGQLRFLP